MFHLKLYRGRGHLPIPQISWPALIDQGHFIHTTCITEETAITAKYYEELLNRAVTHSKTASGKNAVKTNDLGDVISLGSPLADLHLRHVPL
jgi:hypothetical protein